MARRVFYSFHYDLDHWRVQQVVNMGVVDGSPFLTANSWEQVKLTTGIQKWIDDQLLGRSCTVVLIGNQTAQRDWVQYEIKKSWNSNKGVVGVYIHNLLNNQRMAAYKGSNPFERFYVNQTRLSNIVKSYDSPGLTSNDVYAYIKDNLPNWVDEAIRIRTGYSATTLIS